MVKIEAIAKAAGVSAATVSRVLNGSERVAPATREAVLKAARQLGRSLDSELARKRVLVAYVPSGQKMIEHFMASADAYNLSPLYKMLPASSLRVEDVAFDGDFDGVILIDGVISREELEKLRARTPVVECRNYNTVDREVSVMVDDIAIGHLLTKHLVESGRTRIATVRFDESISSRPHAVERMRGYYAALAEAGLVPSKNYLREVDRSPEALLSELVRDAETEWDAVIFPEPLDDLLDLQQRLREQGKNVALASFGDSAALERAGITATDQPLGAIAQASLFMLTSLMDERLAPAASMQLRIEPTLTVRSSTK